MRRAGDGRIHSGALIAGLLLCLWALCASQAWAAPRATAALDRAELAPGEVATLTVTLTNEDATPLMPRVPGLHINLVGQRVSSQYGTGGASTTFSRMYEVEADHEGDYSIAPITIDGVALAPLHLKVVAAAARGAQSGGSAAADEQRMMPTMRVVLPRTRLYVGEQMPIQIKAYFREGTDARMEGALALEGDAFTAAGLDSRPVRSEEIVKGENMTVLTWPATLGAIKSGQYPLQLELPLLVIVRLGGDSALRQRLQALFGVNGPGAFMGDDLDSMFGREVERHLVLKPEVTTVTVLPLPAAGRPADFSGAVGHFAVSASVAPQSGTVGDPLTWTLEATGTGTLSSLDTPGVPASDDWRTYRPTSRLVQDPALAGVWHKTFSQPIVPQRAGHLRVPAVSVSWFDPEAGLYRAQQTPALDVLVKPAASTTAANALGAAAVPAPVPAPLPAASGPAAPVAAAPPGVALYPAPTRTVRSLRPLIREPRFQWLLALPLLTLAATLGWRVVSAGRGPAQRTAAVPAAHLRARLESSVARGDAAEFFRLARAALDGHPQAGGDAARSILQAADQVAYAGAALTPEELRQWQARLAQLLWPGAES